MAIARQSAASLIKPFRDAMVLPGIAGATIEAGELVTLQSDGYWDPGIGTGVVKNVGVSVKAAAVGDPVEVVLHGGIECVTGATPGAIIYVSDTAGEPAETAGTKSAVVGFALSATAIFVNSQTVAFA